jgi:hypothetical protein
MSGEFPGDVSHHAIASLAVADRTERSHRQCDDHVDFV